MVYVVLLPARDDQQSSGCCLLRSLLVSIPEAAASALEQKGWSGSQRAAVLYDSLLQLSGSCWVPHHDALVRLNTHMQT
jgi:hypothetical protein